MGLREEGGEGWSVCKGCGMWVWCGGCRGGGWRKGCGGGGGKRGVNSTKHGPVSAVTRKSKRLQSFEILSLCRYNIIMLMSMLAAAAFASVAVRRVAVRLI